MNENDRMQEKEWNRYHNLSLRLTYYASDTGYKRCM